MIGFLLTHLAVAGLVGLLWALGGADKIPLSVRKIGVPIVLACSLISIGQYGAVQTMICVTGTALILSLGYGICWEEDEGSALAQLWWKVLKLGTDYSYENQRKCAIAVRATLGLAYAVVLLSLRPLPYMWIKSLGCMVISQVLFGAYNLIKKTFRIPFLKAELLREEFVLGVCWYVSAMLSTWRGI